MAKRSKENLIISHHDRCKTCYMCVRECPVKAIKIFNGMSEVALTRCIGCGNCVKVCSQGAKQVAGPDPSFDNLLNGAHKTAAVLDPAFPAEFSDIKYKSLIGMIRRLGFNYVSEGAFGVDIVGKKVKELTDKNDKAYISSSCPSIFYYVIQYHPELTDSLVPLVSPMIAMSRILKKKYGSDLKVVYIGPCIAKKGESWSQEVGMEIDEVITFAELRELFERRNILPDEAEESDFDPPLSLKGYAYANGDGMIHSDNNKALMAHGKENFIEAINEFENGGIKANLLDALCCNGCIMGAGMATDSAMFRRMVGVNDFVKEVVNKRSKEDWEKDLKKYNSTDCKRIFYPNDMRLPPPSEDELKRILNKLGKFTKADEINCRSCGYESCRDHATAIHKGLAEYEMCQPYLMSQLHTTIRELAESHDELARTKDALKQSEKLASMGQLAAGVAHELNNPLGVIIMYSHLLKESLDKDSELFEDLVTISQEADRCKSIVQGLLNFSRKNKVELKEINLSSLIDRCVKLAYIPEEVKVVLRHEEKNPNAEVDSDQIIQVISNLINNAVSAMNGKGTLIVTTRGTDKNMQVSVSDTGCGIAKENLKKIFEPFYTTKGNKGTGLGLAVSYGIIKMHRGQIQVESNNDPAQGPTGATFTIILPRKGDS